MSDNFRFCIESAGRLNFDIAMKLAFTVRKQATHYAINDTYGMILYAYEICDPNVKLLPYPMNEDAAKEFVWNWLQITDYPSEPDHDGDNSKGFCIWNEAWSRVNNQPSAFVAIKPSWQMYGK